MEVLPSLWHHQERGVTAVCDLYANGIRRVLLTSPTGMGKARTSFEVARPYLETGRKVVIYNNRKLLVEQTGKVYDEYGWGDFGLRASDHFPDLAANLQISSIQTENARVYKSKAWELHEADLVIVEEAHTQDNKTANRIVDEHLDKGAHILGLTATPIGLASRYARLVIAGTPSEGRSCGALVPAMHYGPDEPDLRHVGKVTLGDDLSENQNRSAMGKVQEGKPDQKLTSLFGRVFECWNRLNPEQRPTLGFAPGVAESVWFAEQFQAQGVPTAHIDGEEVWVEGDVHRSDRKVREQVLNAFRSGYIKLLWNRYVLREGLDVPCVEHLILATVIGSLQSYLQVGGRGLRSSKITGKTHLTVQDHGGAWHKHGSLNADRDWRLDCNSSILAGQRTDRLRAKVEAEPFRCPQCGMILARLRCPCGFVLDPRAKSRPVVQQDGTLKEMMGDIYWPRKTRTKPDTFEQWKRMYYRARNSKNGMTFRQAEALFFHEQSYFPPRTLRLMPRDDYDWGRKVAEVPVEALL